MELALGFLIAATLVLSFLGWGSFVSKLIFGNVVGAWPFRAAWGMGAVVMLGGVLNAVRGVSVVSNLVVIFVGLALCVPLLRFALLRREGDALAGRSCVLIFAAALIALGAIAVSLFPLRWEPNDDAVAYAMFPRKMLDTGSLDEPFSLRRIVSFGGYHYFHSLVLSVLSHHELHLLDRGIATVLTAAAVVAFVRKRLGGPWGIACLCGAVFMLFPPIRVNLAPTCVLSLFSLTLLETFLLSGELRDLPAWRRAAALALAGATLLAMRANALAIVGSLTVALVLTESGAKAGAYGMVQRIRLLALTGGFAAVMLAPWAVALMRSSATPFFPIIKGNFNAAIPMSVAMSASEWMRWIWENSTHTRLHYLFGIAVIGFACRAIPRSVMCYAACALLTALATIAAFNLSDAFSMARYYGPFTVVASILVGASIVTQLWQRFGTNKSHAVRKTPWVAKVGGPAVAVIALCLGGGLAFARSGMRAELNRHGFNPARVLEARVQSSYRTALPLADTYRAATAALPNEAKVLAAVDAPFLLDFAKHEIICVDDVGAVSPSPGMPTTGGGAALRNYLRGLGFTHLLCVKPAASKTIYTRFIWGRAELIQIWRLRAPYYLEFLDALDALIASQPLLFEDENAVVIDLAASPAPPLTPRP